MTKIYVENGRAVIELYLPDLSDDDGDCYMVYMWDAGNNMVFHCMHRIYDDEPCIIKLFHPKLWSGADNPYIYRTDIYGETGRLIFSLNIPIRNVTIVSENAVELNGAPFVLNGVYCDICGEFMFTQWDKMKNILEYTVRMGANALLCDRLSDIPTENLYLLQKHCDEIGLLVLSSENMNCSEYPSLKTLFMNSGVPGPAYYMRKALWGKEPFVYIDAKSFQKQADGLYRINVYSNQNKVALFVNGKIFGFQGDGPEYIFQDISIRSFPASFAAEAGGCYMSVTCE